MSIIDDFDEWWNAIEGMYRHDGSPPLSPPLGATPTECDQFNRALLATLINKLHEKGSNVTGSEFQVLYRLNTLQSSLDASRGLLLKLDPRGDGIAIVAVGNNPDTATCTTILVPGIDNNLGTMDKQISRAQALATNAQSLLGSAGHACAIAWLGYDPPQAFDLDAAATVRARAGGEALSAFVTSLRTQGTPLRHLSVVGHSYGSVVVGEAARGTQGLNVDDIVVVGSPGMDVDDISQLHIDPHHVWAGAAADDPIVNDFGGRFFGPPPTEQNFGANRFVVRTNGHSNYWESSSESLRNQSLIIVGSYTDVALDWGTLPTEIAVS